MKRILPWLMLLALSLFLFGCETTKAAQTENVESGVQAENVATEPADVGDCYAKCEAACKEKWSASPIGYENCKGKCPQQCGQ